MKWSLKKSGQGKVKGAKLRERGSKCRGRYWGQSLKGLWKMAQAESCNMNQPLNSLYCSPSHFHSLVAGCTQREFNVQLITVFFISTPTTCVVQVVPVLSLLSFYYSNISNIGVTVKNNLSKLLREMIKLIPVTRPQLLNRFWRLGVYSKLLSSIFCHHTSENFSKCFEGW